MNLVQIQEHLKDLPMQAVMSYANGQNPQVPPYLALGEMNRRKQMEQKAAEPPKGTVKDSIEQQMSLMQLQKLRQGQMSQQMGQQGMQAPTIPQGTPEPASQPEEEMAMAAGGITRLPVQDMDFGSSGIIAFKKGDAVKDKEKEKEEEERALADQIPGQRFVAPPSTGEMPGELERNINNTLSAMPGASAMKPFVGGARGVMGLLGGLFGSDGQPKAQNVQAAPAPSVPASVSEAQATALAGPQAAVPPRPMDPPPAPPQNIQAKPPMPPAPPAAPVLSDAQKFQQGILSGSGLQPLPPEYASPQQAPIGEEYMAYMNDRLAKRKADEEKFKQREGGRSQRDFFNSLIAAGEATRGQKGIGSLFGGFGKAYSQTATEAEDRQAAFEKQQQDLADNDAKTKFEIANLRRAEERGDSKTAYESKVKLFELSNQRAQMQSTTANEMARRDAEKELALIKFEYEKKLKGIPQAQRATLEEQYVQAAVKAGKSLPDAIREVKTLGVEAKGQLTYGQAADDVDNFLKSTQGMTYIAGLNKAAKEKNQPMPDAFTIRKNLIDQQMQQSGSKNAPKSKDLAAADAIAGVK